MDYYSKRLLGWSVIAMFVTIIVLASLAAFTNGHLAHRVSCFPNYPSCTEGKNSWDRGFTTCQCVKLPEAP